MTAALAAVIYCFWAFPYRAALSYREEMQLFLTSGSYFRERVTSLSSLAAYCGEFLTQFFNNFWIGAAVMTILFVIVLLLSYRILRILLPAIPKYISFTLAIIPVILVWLLLGDPNVAIDILVIAIAILAGVYVILIVATSLWHVRKAKNGKPDTNTHFATPDNTCHSSARKSPVILTCILLMAEIAAVVILYPRAYDAKTYQLINYDYLVRANDWEGILDYSDKTDPDLPLSVSATNLALGMTGQLDSRAFSYFQNGPEGLVPPFAKETISSWTTGEIFFHLGMLNSARRFYFEGMEAIPTYNKSARAIRRLAEIAMINGDNVLARKYLHLLENTLFYRKWAKRSQNLLDDPSAIDSHPLYGSLRKSVIDETYMFSESELDKTFGQLYLKNPDNSLARQYLIVYPLLQRDLNKFMQYMGVVAESRPDYNPPLAQQVIAFMSMKNGRPVPPGAVAPAIEQQLRNFAKAWTSKDPAQIALHRRSLFHYLVSN